MAKILDFSAAKKKQQTKEEKSEDTGYGPSEVEIAIASQMDLKIDEYQQMDFDTPLIFMYNAAIGSVLVRTKVHRYSEPIPPDVMDYPNQFLQASEANFSIAEQLQSFPDCGLAFMLMGLLEARYILPVESAKKTNIYTWKAENHRSFVLMTYTSTDEGCIQISATIELMDCAAFGITP